MEMAAYRSAYEKRRSKSTGCRWVREWVPQAVISPGGKCSLLKWVTEDTLRALKENNKEIESEEMKPEPTTEVLFLCTYEGCGKTFIDTGALKKHAHIHGERQYICHYGGCGKKFMDSSKLKRHFLIHTGERAYVCPHEGCGKAFSLDFNLRSHMKTHSLENYHVCPFPECGKRFTVECKLISHMKSYHEKNMATDVTKQTPTADKHHNIPKAPAVTYSAASADRPYACPYEGCGKAYIHEYKLNLHLRREHPGHNTEENDKHTPAADHIMDEGSDRDAPIPKGGVYKNSKRSRPTPKQKMPLAKVPNRKGPSLAPANIYAVKQQLPSKEMYEEDSEETEEDGENVEEGRWPYGEMHEDDEETEDESSG